MSDDLRAVSHSHAVSNMGYEVKLEKKEITWNDGKHNITWAVQKQKDGSLLILKKTREVKKHKREAEAGQDLGERELAIINGLLEKALKVLRVKGSLG